MWKIFCHVVFLWNVIRTFFRESRGWFSDTGKVCASFVGRRVFLRILFTFHFSGNYIAMYSVNKLQTNGRIRGRISTLFATPFSSAPSSSALSMLCWHLAVNFRRRRTTTAIFLPFSRNKHRFEFQFHVPNENLTLYSQFFSYFSAVCFLWAVRVSLLCHCCLLRAG